MTEAEVIEALSDRFRDMWPTLSAIPFTLENEIDDSVEQYIRVEVVPTVRRQVTQGSEGGRKFEMRGNVFVQIFGPVNVGAKPLYVIADLVRTVYEGFRIAEELTTYAGSTRPSPTDAVWAMVTVTIPYIAEELR